MNRIMKIALYAFAVLIFPACKSNRHLEEAPEIVVDFDYIIELANDYAHDYKMLSDDELVKQEFLLDVQSRISRLSREVSTTHAQIFEKAFADNAF